MRHIQMKSAGSVANPERLEQRQIVIESVHFLEPKFRKLVVNPGSIARVILHPVSSDALLCPGEKSKKCRAITLREVNAVVEFFSRDGQKNGHVPEVAIGDECPVGARDGGQ